MNLFYRTLEVRGLENLPKDGPVVLAGTHFNSFFDAFVQLTFLKRTACSMARGDAFKKPAIAKILNSFYAIPIHRQSEGTENMSKNHEIMGGVVDKLKEGKMILIYPEGLCLNQTELLPLKKGTARFVQMAIEQNIPVKVVPFAITYSSFKSAQKQIIMTFGQPLSPLKDFKTEDTPYFTNNFTNLLKDKINEIVAYDFKKISQPRDFFYQIFFWINAPAVYAARLLAFKFKKTIFFDSMTATFLILTFPLYWFCVYQLINVLA